MSITYVRIDLKCEHGPVGEAYIGGKACVRCASRASVAAKAKRRRIRDPEKQRSYYKRWYKKHGHRYNVELATKRRTSPAAIAASAARTLAREIADIHDLGVLARRWSTKHRSDPVYRFAMRKRSELVIRSPTRIDWDTEWLARKIREALATGTMTLEKRSPRQVSVDQAIAGLGYHKANIQLLPLWLNCAKRDWAEADVVAAIESWVDLKRSSTKT